MIGKKIQRARDASTSRTLLSVKGMSVVRAVYMVISLEKPLTKERKNYMSSRRSRALLSSLGAKNSGVAAVHRVYVKNVSNVEKEESKTYLGSRCV